MTRVSFRVIHVRTLIIATIVAISAAIVIGVVVYGIVRSGHEHISGIGAGHEPAAASVSGQASEDRLFPRLSQLFWQGVLRGRDAIGIFVRDEAIPVTALPLHQPAPPFTLTDTTGKTVDITSFRGRPVIIVFWASWCPDCPSQLSALTHVYNHFRGAAHQEHSDGTREARDPVGSPAPLTTDDPGVITVIAVNVMEDVETVHRFAEQHRLPFPLVLDTDGAVSNAYVVRITPTIVLVDKDGIVRDRLFGLVDRDTIIARVQGLL